VHARNDISMTSSCISNISRRTFCLIIADLKAVKEWVGKSCTLDCQVRNKRLRSQATLHPFILSPCACKNWVVQVHLCFITLKSCGRACYLEEGFVVGAAERGHDGVQAGVSVLVGRQRRRPDLHDEVTHGVRRGQARSQRQRGNAAAHHGARRRVHAPGKWRAHLQSNEHC
jgi:hypothetical protein